MTDRDDVGTFLLVPGRHLANTCFQERYLRTHADDPAHRPQAGAGLQVVFAVTSANQQHSRYNPISFHVRAIGVDRFARQLGLAHRIVGIPHYRPTPRFARNVLLEIEAQTEGELNLTPANTQVVCSTDGVAQQFASLGFTVLEAEADEDGVATPIDLVRQVAASGADWATDEMVGLLSSATRSLWTDFPEVPRRITRLYGDPLLNEHGSLTDTRDYGVYVFAMSNPAVLEQKYADVKALIAPGKIVDEGCADGALLGLIARDFPDSDLIGIEITGEFLAQCTERLRRGGFGGTHVHFHQRNLFDPIFEDASIDTTICNSTLHELWSYGEREKTVRTYLDRKFAQTTPGGRIVIRDVVGPEDKARQVLLWCDAEDGAATGAIETLSTAARFRRFAREFLPGPVDYSEADRHGRACFSVRLRDAVEFMSKKDYAANWASEMHETFAFWSLSEWRGALVDAGFRIVEGTRAYANPWIVDNRYRGRVALYDAATLEPIDYPVTTMVLVGQK